MVVERTITVGFHSNFGAFKRNRRSKTLTRLAITDEFPFNPTYESQNSVTNLAQFSFFVMQKIQMCFPCDLLGKGLTLWQLL